MDCEKLIRLVEERRSLWNNDDIAYHNRDIARRLWDEIATILENTSSGVKTKWQYLRDTYRRELVKIDSKWKFFNQMSFLQDTYGPRRLVGNVPRPHQSDEDYSPEIGESLHQSMSDYEDEIIEQQSDEQESGNSCSPYVTRAPNKLFKSTKKRPRVKKDGIHDLVQLEKVKVSHLKELKNKKGDIEEDEDYFFLMSLLPHLRAIPQHKKLKTRIRIQQVLLECHPTNQTSTSYHHSTPLGSPSEYSNSPSPNSQQSNMTCKIEHVEQIIKPHQEAALGDFLCFKP